MSAAICTRCHIALPEFPASGTCPSCGSQLALETPRTFGTAAATLTLAPPELRGTATLPPASELTRSQADTHPSPKPTSPGPVPVLVNYRNLEFLSRGGMGVVYKGIQHRTDRVVAIKFIHASAELHPTIVGRFDTEAKALSRAKHPSIVPILEVGDDDRGRRFFSMEYYPNGTLAQRVKAEGPLPLREAAELTAEIADAVAAAHAVGVLHRDLKPGNVLLASDGSPRVTDFGLAKLDEAESSFTGTGDLLGTPGYMSPEQARGTSHEADVRTDIYGLGAILYDLLTGRAPFVGTNRQSTVMLVLTTEVTPPRALRKDIPADLEAVCLKCLAKDSGRRYATASEASADLRRWLGGEATSARPLTRLQKFGRTATNYRVSAVGTAFGLALAILVAFAVANARRDGAKLESPVPPVGLPDAETIRRIQRSEKDERWNAIAKELEAGKSVTLVGPTGGPAWSEWVQGNVQEDLSITENATFGFQTFTSSLLLLGRDPMCDHYRISCEIRHLKTNGDMGSAGLFIGHSNDRSIEKHDCQEWLRYSYSEFWNVVELQNINNSADKHGLNATHCVVVNKPEMRSVQTSDLGYFPFEPVNDQPTPWRRIAIDVYPDGCDVYFSRQLDRLEFASYVTECVYGDSIERIEANKIMTFRDRKWKPRGGFGVYGNASAISIRNVTVVPLRPSPKPL